MNKLLNWQVRNKTGKFKPLGFISRESEITLAPTEIIAYDKNLGFVISKGQKIPIVRAKVIKPKGKLKKLLNDFDNGKLTDAEIKQLEKLLYKETKVKYDLQSYSLKKKPYINLKSYSTKLLSRVAKSKVRPSKAKVSKAKISKPRVSKPRVSKPRPSKPRVSKPRVSKPRVSKPRPSKPRVSKPRSPRRKPPKPVPVVKPRLKVNFKSELPRGVKFKVDGYVKVGKRSYKVVSGLPLNKAWNKVYIKGGRKFRSVEDSTPRSFEFRVVGLTKAKDDLRKIGTKQVRSRIGKDPKVLKVVEKSKYAINTRGEKLGLAVRRKAVKRKTALRKSKKRVSNKKRIVKKRTPKKKKRRKVMKKISARRKKK